MKFQLKIILLILALTVSMGINAQAPPTARHECAFVELDGKFYLIGGRGIKPVDIYNPVTKSWSQGAPTPIEMHHFQAVAYEDKIYIMGAFTGKYPFEKPIEYIYSYEPGSDQWNQEAIIPKGRLRGAAGLVVVGKMAYMLPGIQNGHADGHVPWTDAYNFETGQWEKLADAPRARDHYHGAYRIGKIYCVGGRNSSYSTGQTFQLTIPEVDVYDIKTNSWNTLDESTHLPTERAGSTSLIVGKELIVMGGESGIQQVAHDEVEALNVTTQTWRSLKPLQRGRHGTQSILYKGRIYLMAGCGNRGGNPELDLLEFFEIPKVNE